MGILGGTALVGGSVLLNSSIYSVDAGHLAIKYNRLTGVGSTTYREGVQFMLPWFERPITFDVRARPHTMTTLTGSGDLQMVNISVRTLVRPDPNKLPNIYRYLGMDFEEKVLPSIVNEVLKSVVAQYNASQLVVQRELVSRMIRQRLVERAKDFFILLDDVAITHLSFSPEYEKAIEAKQVAQQQEEKKRVIIHAEGEQQSAAMIGSAIKANPGFLDLRRIQVAKEVAANLSKSSNRMVLSSEALLLNLAHSIVTENVSETKKK